MNHPSANAGASRKLEQLSVAAHLGIKVPDTLVTQEPEKLKAFYKKNQGRLIAKPLSTGYVERRKSEADSLIYTSRLNETDLENLDELSVCPTLFQQFVEKDYDVRITVVDSAMVAVKLEAKESDGTQRCDIRRNNMVDHLEGRCQVAPDAFRGFYRADGAGAILINVENGIVRVTANEPPELLPHDAGHLFTLRTAAKFDPQADAKQFKKTLGELLPDELDRDLLQLCFGNYLLPDCRFEVALVCYGEANCGKSTIAEPVAAAMGAELVARLAMSQICDTKSYHLHKLQFAAVNLGTELDVIAIDESANFKLIVSGEPVEARPIYGKPLTMETSCKLWFLANGLPRFKNGTEAELRRTRFIRFARRPAVNDVTLKDKLKAERDGVFNFMLGGLQRLLTVQEIPLGGSESQSVHARFKVSNDPLGTFVAQHCQLAPDGREPKAALQSTFNSFCETHGLPVELGDWFFKRLYERFTNLKEVRAGSTGGRVRCIAGIKLKTMLETD
jgi:P4 family phage/plasmid primase-like protien